MNVNYRTDKWSRTSLDANILYADALHIFISAAIYIYMYICTLLIQLFN